MRALILLPMLTALAMVGCGAEGENADEAGANPQIGSSEGGQQAGDEVGLVKLKLPGMV